MNTPTLRRHTASYAGLLLLAASASLVSCATLRHLSFERPTVELDTVEISGLDLDGVSLVLWLDVYNPNGYEIQTTRIEAELGLEDTHFGNATMDRSVPLPPASHTIVKIPASFTWEGVGAAARALLGRGTVNYDLDTRLRIETSLGARSVSFSHRGEVQVKDLVP
jgi:LEA14-like dessication related protein